MTPNLAAFLAVIRACEGTSGPNGYRTLFGGELFDSYADHPRIVVNKSGYKSTAAGAYQALAGTWDDFIKAEGPHDFSPSSQDLFARWCIKRRGALADVEAGRLSAAIEKCNKEWASLPGSPYGQPTRDLAYCERIFHLNGGDEETASPLSPPAVPASPMPPVDQLPKPEPAPQPAAPSPVQPPKEDRTMGATFISAFLPAIFEMFAGRAAAGVQKISGAPPDVAAGFVKSMAKKVEDLSGITVTDNATALKAVAAVVDDPAKMQELQDHALDYIEKVGPLLDKLAAHELAMARQADESADRAAARGQKDRVDIGPQLARWAMWVFATTAVVLGIVMIVQVYTDAAHKVDGVLIGLLTILVYAAARIAESPFRYRFGGNADSQVIDSGNAAVRSAIPNPGGKQ